MQPTDLANWLDDLAADHLIRQRHQEQKQQLQRQKRKHDEDEATANEPPSPPVSMNMLPTEGTNPKETKRRKLGQDLDVETDSGEPGITGRDTMPERTTEGDLLLDEDIGRTARIPRSSRRQSQSLVSSRLSGSKFNSSSRYSGSVRSSPSKRLADLALREEGLIITGVQVDLVPSRAQALVFKMQDIAQGQGMVDAELKPLISRLQSGSGDYREFRESCYRTPCESPSSFKASGHETIPEIIDSVLGKAHRVFLDLQQATEAAYVCQSDQFDEAGWNNKVHTKIMDAAIQCASNGEMICIPCMNAPMTPQYKLPGDSMSRIDYVFCLDPSRLKTVAAKNPMPDITGPNTVAKAVDRVRTNELGISINHTSYYPLLTRPMTISIETKRYDGHKKAEWQLGTWLGAHWNKLESMVTPEDLASLPFLPGVLVDGHEWTLVISTFQNRRTHLWNCNKFGSTASLFGSFQVLAGLQALIDWSRQEYWPWFQYAVLAMRANDDDK